MKKIYPLICSCFLLVSCFGGADNAAWVDGLTQVESEEFSIRLSTSWNVIPSSELSPIEDGNVEIAYRSWAQDKDFLNNIIVISEVLDRTLSSSDYAKRNVYLASRWYKNLRDIQAKNIAFEDGDTSRLYVFEAQYQPQFSKTLFFQTAKVCADNAYVITIGLDTSVQESAYTNYETIIQSFICK